MVIDKYIIFAKSVIYENGIFKIQLDNVSTNKYINRLIVQDYENEIIVKVKHSSIPFFKQKNYFEISTNKNKTIFLIENNGKKRLIHEVKD
jgi:hypothetical protein